MTTTSDAALLGIDWGTSNRRAWWLAADGRVLAEHADAQGLLAVQGRFAESLAALRSHGPALADGAPLLMAGMVGSASGWQEVRYLDAATPLAQIARHLVPLPPAGPRAFIVPGMCFAAVDGSVDVMRGEETQLLGAQALGHGDGWFVLPGTHSKWVRLEHGAVADLATFMTGELFALLTQHGTLAGITREGDADPQAFARGVAAAGRSGLSNALFGCRAQVVSGRMLARGAREYLSGLLIGAEWHDVARRIGRMPERVTLIGSAGLVAPYAAAAAAFGCTLTPLDAREVQLAALHALRQAL
jgi:2-dehydro-3-deoxygalactonokinase